MWGAFMSMCKAGSSDAAAFLQGDALGDPSIGLTEEALLAQAADFEGSDDVGAGSEDTAMSHDDDDDNSAESDVDASAGQLSAENLQAAVTSSDLDAPSGNDPGQPAGGHGGNSVGIGKQPWDIEDAELDDVNIFELPSGSSASSDFDDEALNGDVTAELPVDSTNERSSANDRGDIDGAQGVVDGAANSKKRPAAAVQPASKKARKRAGKHKDDSLFAAAEEYEDMLARLDEQDAGAGCACVTYGMTFKHSALWIGCS